MLGVLLCVSVCVVGLCWRALVQTVPGNQAPDWKRARGRESEEGQVHPERHGPAGRRCGVLRLGEMDKHINYTQIHILNVLLISWCFVFGERQKNSHTCSYVVTMETTHRQPKKKETLRRLPTSVWRSFSSVGVFRAKPTRATRPSMAAERGSGEQVGGQATSATPHPRPWPPAHALNPFGRLT